MVRYVSVVITCPYSGEVDYTKVKSVSRALLDMGCYEVSLGDTVGTGNPTSIREMLETVMGGSNGLPAQQLAVRFCISLLACLHIFTGPLRLISTIHSAPQLQTL